jgi:signal transduction histidine kinase
MAKIRPRRVWLAWAVLLLVLVLDAISIALRVALRADSATASRAGVANTVWSSVYFLVAAVIGLIVVSRQPRNPNGLILLALGVGFSVTVFADSYARYALLLGRGARWSGLLAGWISRWAPIPIFVLIGLLLLLFPDGKPPGPRWNTVRFTLLLGGALLMVGFPFLPGALDDSLGSVRNPVGVGHPWSTLLTVVAHLGFPLLAGSVVLAAVSLVVRWRRGGPLQRQQLRWVALAGGAAVIATVASNAVSHASPAYPYASVLGDMAFLGLFVAIGVAILQHRMYDVDVVVNRAVVYSLLVVFVTGTYVVIVVGIGALLGHPGQDNLALSVLATAAVAITFAPVRERARVLANRLVYGEAKAPYDVLAELGRRLSSMVSPDDILPSMARTAATGVGAAGAVVRVVLADGSERAAAWPEETTGSNPDAYVAPVDLIDDHLGQIEVVPRPGAALTRQQRRLIDDLAHQAVLALSNLRLTLQLQDQLARVSEQAAELQASRMRLVTAQDAERRRLERNIHDGAQQHLVALTIRLRTAAAIAPPDVAEELEDIRLQATETIGVLRDLARGIFPPLLADAGVGAALQAHIAKAQVRAQVLDRVPPGVRAEPQVEAAVYFCCLEALQNVTKHGGEEASATIRLEQRGEELNFEIADDGPGFDTAAGTDGSGLQGMADRMAAVGGRLDVQSTLGVGTTISGSAPLGQAARTPAVA